MIIFSRSGTMLPGKFTDGKAFLDGRAAYLKDAHGIDVSVFSQLGGPAGRVSLVSQHESIAELEEIRRKIIADPQSAENQRGAAGIFVPGRTMDAIWMKL